MRRKPHVIFLIAQESNPTEMYAKNVTPNAQKNQKEVYFLNIPNLTLKIFAFSR